MSVFLRADEIEMLMTDLERANQVTCCVCVFFLPFLPRVIRFSRNITHNARHSFFFFFSDNFKNHVTELLLLVAQT